eukprot:8165007-Karenia_brevis.AAC.1
MRSLPDLTMGEIISDTRNYAASLFMIRPNISTSTAIVPYIPPQSSKGKPRGASQDSQPKGKGKGKSKNKGPFASQVGFRTRKFTNDGKEICKRFNDARGCVVSGCSNAH